MRRATVALLTATTALTLAGCGGGGGEASATAQTSSTAPTSSAAAATTASDPYDVYLAADTRHGLTPGVQRGEAVSVAGNTCDNTVADMKGLVTQQPALYPDSTSYARFLADRANFVDAYCPSARVVFDAATQAVAGVIVPPAS